MTDPREAIAYHEAGHAVISMKLGYKCLYVTIIPDDDRLGHVCCESRRSQGLPLKHGPWHSPAQRWLLADAYRCPCQPQHWPRWCCNVSV